MTEDRRRRTDDGGTHLGKALNQKQKLGKLKAEAARRQRTDDGGRMTEDMLKGGKAEG